MQCKGPRVWAILSCMMLKRTIAGLHSAGLKHAVCGALQICVPHSCSGLLGQTKNSRQMEVNESILKSVFWFVFSSLYLPHILAVILTGETVMSHISVWQITDFSWEQACHLPGKIRFETIHYIFVDCLLHVMRPQRGG
jgi:hypothetical protein